ncbi:MAG: DUF1552 domain-containing protein [Planctomycetota bacterium]
MRRIDRRNLLQFGAALPLAMHSLGNRTKARSNSRKTPKRIIFICNSLGFYKPYFFPTERGDLESSKYLSGFANREKLTVFQNLFHPGMETSNHDSEKSFLTGAAKPEAPNFVNTMSVDQVLAKHLGGETRFPFLSFSIYDRGWGCSWNDRGVAIPPTHNEKLIYNKLFGEEDLSAKQRQIQNDQQIVDCLYRDMRQLEDHGTGEAKAKIATYRKVIDELEKQLAHEAFWLKTQKPDIPNTLSRDPEFAFSTKVSNLLQLAKLAFQTDSTRIITLSLDWIYGAIQVPGATGGWHTLSHHGGRPEVIEKLTRIEKDITKHLNRFLASLDETPEGDETLLDHTTVVVGSNFGDSSNHTCNNLPTLVAGGGIRHQAHQVLDKPTPLCNLWLELLQSHDIDIGKFGSSEENSKLLPI